MTYKQRYLVSCIAPGFIEIAEAKESKIGKGFSTLINVNQIASIEESNDGCWIYLCTNNDGCVFSYWVDCGIGAFRTSLIIANGGTAYKRKRAEDE